MPLYTHTCTLISLIHCIYSYFFPELLFSLDCLPLQSHTSCLLHPGLTSSHNRLLTVPRTCQACWPLRVSCLESKSHLTFTETFSNFSTKAASSAVESLTTLFILFTAVFKCQNCSLCGFLRLRTGGEGGRQNPKQNCHADLRQLPGALRVAQGASPQPLMCQNSFNTYGFQASGGPGTRAPQWERPPSCIFPLTALQLGSDTHSLWLHHVWSPDAPNALDVTHGA